jgi:GTP:adenosylcobinamide-phosphate guanylyltransferase
MDAILIAGGRAHAPLSEVAGHSVKGLFSLHGATLITRVLHALQQAGVRRIAVVGSELLLHALPSLDAEMLFAVEGSDPIDNLLRGVERLGLPSEAQFLHCAVDLPMLTGRALCDLIHAAPPDADVVVGWTPESAFVQMFPGAPYTALRFAEGRFLTASASVMRVGFLEAQLPLLRRLAAARKSAGKVALDASPRLPLPSGDDGRCPWRRAFSRDASRWQACPRLPSGCSARSLHLYLNAAPELAYDIDADEDYRYAQAWLQAHSRYTL